MFDITKLIYKIDKAIPADVCQKFIDIFNSNGDNHYFESSADANELKHKQSSFKTYDLKPNTEHFNYIKTITQNSINSYVDYLASSNYFHKGFKTALRYSHKYRVLKYDKGAQIHPHVDHSPYVYASIVINLNEDYEGGEFCFFNKNHNISLKQGDIMIFPADYFWVHEVSPITKGNRYSVNSFISSLPLDIRTELYKDANKKELNYLEITPSSEILGPYDLYEEIKSKHSKTS